MFEAKKIGWTRGEGGTAKAKSTMLAEYKKEVLDPQIRRLRQENYLTYMTKTSIPERVITMAERLGQTPCCPRQMARAYQPHMLDSSNTFVNPTVESTTRGLPFMISSAGDINRSRMHDDVLRSTAADSVIERDWARVKERSEIVASISVEEGTSCGARMLRIRSSRILPRVSILASFPHHRRTYCHPQTYPKPNHPHN